MKILLRLWVIALAVSSAKCGVLSFTDYHNPSQVDAALTTLNSTYPGQTAILTIGTSVEGRPIKVLKISNNPAADDPTKGDVVFVGLHHAREWISTEVALYVADQLLAKRLTDPEVQADMNNLQIWIIPVLNPDGFDYTVNTYRYWRKNRRLNGDGTFGVDLNRNYSYQWGLTSGASPNPPDDTYFGTGPFSEPETAAMRDFLQNRGNLKAFLSYHSFSELFLRPWSYTTAVAPGEPTLRSIALRNIADIAAVHGVTYAEHIGYTSSGEATDFVWNGTRMAPFTTELRPASGGLDGFSPPATEILPCAEENLPSALALVHDAGRTGLWIKDHPLDDGSEPSATWTGSGWSRPFWESPDITTVPTALQQGATVTLNIHVRNNTGMDQHNVTVEAYYTDPRISLEFPNPIAVLIASQIITVPSAGADISMPWTVPIGANSWGELHWCVGVVIKHDHDMPLSTQVNRSSNVGCRNFNTEPMKTSQLLLVLAQNYLPVPVELQVKVDNVSLPDGWKVILARPPELLETNRVLTATERKARLLGATGQLLDAGQSTFVPLRIIVPTNVTVGTEADIRIHGGLVPLVAGKRNVVGNGFTYHVIADKP